MVSYVVRRISWKGRRVALTPVGWLLISALGISQLGRRRTVPKVPQLQESCHIDRDLVSPIVVYLMLGCNGHAGAMPESPKHRTVTSGNDVVKT